jgi:hypothetical protein
MEVSSAAKLGKTLATSAVLAMAAIGVGLLVAWYLGNRQSVSLAVPDNPPAASPPLTGVEAPVAPRVSQPLIVAPPRTIPDTTMEPTMLDSRTWGDKLEDILLRGTDKGSGVNDKSDGILALMSNAPPEALPELSQHLVNMTQDDHYDGLAGLLTNANTQPDVATVLFNDLLNRRNTLKLPMLLAIAQNDDHPYKGQAKDMLELFIQTDYGTNWSQWSGAVDSWLQQNEQ